MAELEEAVLVATARTPMGRYGGQLKDVRPDDLAATAIREAVSRAGIQPGEVDDVIFGCANQAGEDNRNVARMGLLLAGLPVEVPGQTVNRLCGSGMQATISAAREIQSGGARVMVAGGVESMTRAPWVMAKPGAPYARGPQTAYDTALGWRLVNPKMAEMYGTLQMGETAERVAAKYEVDREAQDEFALRSHRNAVAAQQAGRFGPEIVPVQVPQRKGEPLLLTQDEGPRADSSLEALAGLRPAFQKDGTVTAGNSSPLNDGAGAMLLADEAGARAAGRDPIARGGSRGVAAVDPDVFGIAPVQAVNMALERAGIGWDDVSVVELNEAFASQCLADLSQWKELDPDTLNPNGGAIALGHPLGASGVRILGSLAHELKRRGGGYGVAALSIGVGQGLAVVLET